MKVPPPLARFPADGLIVPGLWRTPRRARTARPIHLRETSLGLYCATARQRSSMAEHRFRNVRAGWPRRVWLNSKRTDAALAQRQSTAFVKPGFWVQIPEAALTLTQGDEATPVTEDYKERDNKFRRRCHRLAPQARMVRRRHPITSICLRHALPFPRFQGLHRSIRRFKLDILAK